MRKLQILTIGRHPDILQTVVRLVNNNPDWECMGVQSDEEALAAFTAHPFDLVLLGGGIEEQSEEKLCNAFKTHKPGIIIIQHYGGGSGLLIAEIYEGLRGLNLG